MKPGKYDLKLYVLISGQELEELQRHVWLMAESFGLDRRIANYQGKRPIGLYRWDVDCLLDVMDSALKDTEEYPSQAQAGYLALLNLKRRLQDGYEVTFPD